MTDGVAKITIHDEVNITISGIDLPVKRALVAAVEHFIPAARYSAAYKLGRWNGCRSFATLGGKSYLGVLDKLIPVLQKYKFEFEIDDQREEHSFDFGQVTEDYYGDQAWPYGHRFAGEPIRLRDYQVEAVNTFLNNPAGINVLPTSAGKTIVTATLSKMIEPYGRSIVIVPNKNLVQQTEEDYRNIGLDVGVLYGDRKEYECKHTICTWQSLNVMDKKRKDDAGLTPHQLEKLMDGLVCVIVDECHAVKDTNVLHTLMTGIFRNVPIRWGLTGTIPEEEISQLGLFTGIGPLIGELTAKELQDKGVIAKCNVTVIQTQETKKYSSYQEEMKFLTTDPERLKWLAEFITEISQTGNTLVLVDRIETGKLLYNQLSNATFISGQMKSKDRREHYKDLNFGDDKIMVATSATTSTGISINRIFNLVLVECGKSFVKLTQSIGRSLRMADDKDHANIYDICSKMTFSNNHLTKRKAIYKKLEYPFEVKKTTY